VEFSSNATQAAYATQLPLAFLPLGRFALWLVRLLAFSPSGVPDATTARLSLLFCRSVGYVMLQI